jgi:hypothetical protein
MSMTTVSYRDDLLKRLEDPEYSALYLDEVIATGDRKALMIALRDVVDARGAWEPCPTRCRSSAKASTRCCQSRGTQR